MGFDFSWLLWCLPLAFVLGWLASRYDLRQWRAERKQNREAYFPGLNHLLNEGGGPGRDAFIEAVQNDPRHLRAALRARQPVPPPRRLRPRAVRCTSTCCSAATWAPERPVRAQHALAQDFLKSRPARSRRGCADQARRHRVRHRGAAGAAGDLRALARLGTGRRCRQPARGQRLRFVRTAAGALPLRGRPNCCASRNAPARHCLALEAAGAAHAEIGAGWILLADLRQSLGDTSGGLQALRQLAEHAPPHLPLVAHSLAQWAADQPGEDRPAAAARLARPASALARRDAGARACCSPDDPAAARQLYIEHLQREPSPGGGQPVAGRRAFRRARAGKARQAGARPCLRTAQKRYRCAACGFEAAPVFLAMPGCQSWDSYPPLRVEEL